MPSRRDYEYNEYSRPRPYGRAGSFNPPGTYREDFDYPYEERQFERNPSALRGGYQNEEPSYIERYDRRRYLRESRYSPEYSSQQSRYQGEYSHRGSSEQRYGYGFGEPFYKQRGRARRYPQRMPYGSSEYGYDEDRKGKKWRAYIGWRCGRPGNKMSS